MVLSRIAQPTQTHDVSHGGPAFTFTARFRQKGGLRLFVESQQRNKGRLSLGRHHVETGFPGEQIANGLECRKQPLIIGIALVAKYRFAAGLCAARRFRQRREQEGVLFRFRNAEIPGALRHARGGAAAMSV